MKRQGIALAVLLSLSLACGLVAPAAAPEATDTESIVSATLTAIAAEIESTPAPPTQTGGVAVGFSGNDFVIPQGLATSATPSTIPASLDSQAPYWDIYPSYVEFALDGYILQGTFHEPRIRIYPVAEFEAANEGAVQIIEELRTLLAAQGAPLPANLPFLPLFNAGQMFHAQEQFITFQNGAGIRYLTQYGQDISPVNNHAMFYTLQGLTSDGRYYVSAILPSNAPFLSEFPSPQFPVPLDGIPFDWENWENAQTYMDAVTQKLNETDAATFMPSLASLDTMMQSLLVTEIP
ncbi:MAG: hypothetical protein QY332_11135 [Anaerolineales bacterium]|nr:MAG: hypothetical protein QY332_11135 [Anaerolineales bacterium]